MIETKLFSTVYIIAAILLLQCTLHVMLFPMIKILYLLLLLINYCYYYYTLRLQIITPAKIRILAKGIFFRYAVSYTKRLYSRPKFVSSTSPYTRR